MNPVKTQIDLKGAKGNGAGSITCETNAGFVQQAIVSVTNAKGRVVASGTFQGKGEKNQIIPLTTGGTILTYKNAKLPLTLSVECQYKNNGDFTPNAPNKVVMRRLVDNKTTELIQVTAEDWVDNDFNDLIVNCVTSLH